MPGLAARTLVDDRVRPLDMFPHTTHSETVAVLDPVDVGMRLAVIEARIEERCEKSRK